MCSKKDMLEYMSNKNFWMHAGIQKNNDELILLSKKITSLLSDKRLKWNSKNIEPWVYIDNDSNCINFICDNKGIKCAKVIFNSRKNNTIGISAYTTHKRKKSCYINISWDRCIEIISDIIS